MARSWRRRDPRHSISVTGCRTPSAARLDMIVLHLVLVLRRLRGCRRRRPPSASRCSTGSAATWTTISAKWGWATSRCPRRCGGSAEAFYGRAKAYEAALAADGTRGAGGGARPQRLRQRRAASGRPAACGLYAGGGAAASAHSDAGALARGELAFPRSGGDRAAARARQGSRPMSDRPSIRRSRPWSVPVAVAEFPETGRRIELAPDAATRAAIAKARRRCRRCRGSSAAFDLTRHGGDGLHVAGPGVGDGRARLAW